MSKGLHKCRHRGYWSLAALLAIQIVIASGRLVSQTPSTGALTGVTLDPAGRALPDVIVRLTSQDSNTTRSVTSDKEGRFSFLLLAPGRYGIEATRAGFAELIGSSQIDVNVTEVV